jgi:hypothetical protein
MQSLKHGVVGMTHLQSTKPDSQPTEDERNFPSTPSESPGSGSGERDKPYPPGGIPNPMPGVNPQQTPGIDGPSPIATPADDATVPSR